MGLSLRGEATPDVAPVAKRTGRSESFPYVTRYAETRQGPVAYFDEGVGEALIFVHGLVGDFTHFEHVAPAFEAQHRVIGLDLPGCGLSCRPAVRHSIRAYAETVLQLMGDLRIDRALLIGHSAGGQVCAQAALMAPERVSRLVLINSAGLYPYSWPLRWLAWLLIRPQLLAAVLERVAMPILSRVFAARNAYTEKFITDALNRSRDPALFDIGKVFCDLRPDLLEGELERAVDSLLLPVLLLWGDCDRLFPLHRIQQFATALPNGRLEVVRDCGHMPIIECPEETVARLRRFIKAPAFAGPATDVAAA